MSTFLKNILLCLLLVPNIVMARGGEPSFFIIGLIVVIALVQIFLLVASYRSVNKNEGSTARTIGRILFSGVLYIFMIVLLVSLRSIMLYPIVADALNLLDYLFWFDLLGFLILLIIPAYLGPILAHKIIK